MIMAISYKKLERGYRSRPAAIQLSLYKAYKVGIPKIMFDTIKT